MSVSNIWQCPVHATTVTQRPRMYNDRRTGERKYGGTYYGCPYYGQGCDYSVRLDTGKPSGKTAREYGLIPEEHNVKIKSSTLGRIIREEITRARKTLIESNPRWAGDRFHTSISGYATDAQEDDAAQEGSPFDDASLWTDDESGVELRTDVQPSDTVRDEDVEFAQQVTDKYGDPDPEDYNPEDATYYSDMLADEDVGYATDDLTVRDAASDPSYSTGTPDELFPTLPEGKKVKIKASTFQRLMHEEVARARKLLSEAGDNFPQRQWPDVYDASQSTGPAAPIGSYKETLPSGVGVSAHERMAAWDDDETRMGNYDELAFWDDGHELDGTELDVDQDLAGAGVQGTPDELFPVLDEGIDACSDCGSTKPTHLSESGQLSCPDCGDTLL